MIVVVLLVVVAAIWIIREIKADTAIGDDTWPLYAQPLLSEREQVLYQRLVAAYPDYVVLAQVALSQLLAVKPGTANCQSIRGRYKQLVADFVLCRQDFTAVLVIELDDSSHAAADRQFADQRKTKAVEAAGLRLVRIPAGPIPSDDEIQRVLQVGGTSSVPIVAAQSTAQPEISRETAATLMPVLSLILVGLIVAAGWVGFVHFTSSTPKVDLPALAPASVAMLKPPVPASAPINVPTLQDVERKRLEAARALAAQQAADDLEKRKQAAWAAFYKPPAFCEHPPAWQDQVECGNQYIRAKRQFEKLWASKVILQPAQ